MPPFRKWWVFLIPGAKVILDVRDGWSIAMDNGYGGNVGKRPVKAFFARMVERWAIRRAYLTITCTPGLKVYLECVSRKPVFLITNGVSDSDYELSKVINIEKSSIKIDSKVKVLCCAGKFSEYGQYRIKKLIDVISKRYGSSGYLIKIFGADKLSNSWLNRYVEESSFGRGDVVIFDRLPKDQLYREISKCDIGISVLRDPKYEFGTKVFDYLALGLPILNYFDEPNAFTEYFDGYLDVPFNNSRKQIDIVRSSQVETVFLKVFSV
jgi:hypothetical protein